MTSYRFTTNIHCGNCVRAVSGFLDDLPGIQSWEVDTEDERKILTVRSEGAKPEAIIATVAEAGFDIQQI